MTLVTGESHYEMHGRHKYDTLSVELPTNDTDIRIWFPNGRSMELQWRVENGTLDVCLPENLGVTNWIGDHMEAAPAIEANFPETRLAKQLVIDFGEEYLVKKED